MPSGIDGGAGIARFVRIVPIGFVSGELQVYLSRFQLRLLQTYAVRIDTLKNIGKSFAHNGSQAVYVPADKFHPTETTLHRPWCL